jgi:TonB family protein
MQTGTKRALEPPADSLVELPPHGRLPRLDLGVDWESPWQEFRTSVRDFFEKSQAPKESELPQDSHLRVHWIRGRNSGWAFAASSAWHVIVVVLLILPIWGFLPATAHNLAPVQIELTYTPSAQDLPHISLPAPGPKRNAVRAPKIPATDPAAQPGADAFHPRQTILSIPVRVTHPRQTLIRPDAPAAPPKIEPALPNIVQWAAAAPVLARPRLEIAPSVSAPKVQRRATANVAAPDVPTVAKNSEALSVVSAAAVTPQLKKPMIPVSTAVAQAHRARASASGAAPEVGATNGDPNLRSVVALSATPAPPAPEVSVPAGNLAARVAISPDGKRPGSPNGSGGGANGNTVAGVGSAGGTGTLPAAVSVSGGNAHAGPSGGTAPGQSHTKLLLKPAGSLPDRPEPMNARKGPANVADLGPNEAPEKILSGKEVYTLNVNLPNLTSSSGSWILNFAQLDEEASPFNKPKGTVSGPVPTRKIDPKYPPAVIKENIEGEVVLYAIIRADGSVDSIQLVRKLDPRLDTNAMQALAQWKFRPATRDGAPIDIEAVVHIPFRYHPPPE